MNYLKNIPGHFLFGQALEMKNEGVSFYERLHREHGDAVKARLFWKDFYLFFHPEHIKEVLQDKPDIFIKGDQYNQLRHMMGLGLLTSEGEEWERQRRLLNPLFGKKGLDILLEQIKLATSEFLSQFNEKNTNVDVDWSRKLFDYSLQVAMKSFFGSQLNEDEMNQMAVDSYQTMRFISRRMTSVLPLPLSLPTAEHRQFKSSLSNIKSVVERTYEHKKAFLETHPDSLSKDMLDLLISAEDEDKYRLSKSQVFDQVLSFLIAGHETTAQTLGWLFFLLAKNPHIQSKIITECEKNNYEFSSSNSLANYPYLEAVINETMRLYPAGWVIARNSKEADSVGNFHVAKNKVVAVCPFVAHRDQRWWVNPHEFQPERFLDQEQMDRLPKGAFVPFSIGRRNCIGSRFAQIEMMVLIIEFFKKFTLSTTLGEIGVKGFVTLKNAEPIIVKIYYR
jgi:cytochrome P450